MPLMAHFFLLESSTSLTDGPCLVTTLQTMFCLATEVCRTAKCGKITDDVAPLVSARLEARSHKNDRFIGSKGMMPLQLQHS